MHIHLYNTDKYTCMYVYAGFSWKMCVEAASLFSLNCGNKSLKTAASMESPWRIPETSCRSRFTRRAEPQGWGLEQGCYGSCSTSYLDVLLA